MTYLSISDAVNAGIKNLIEELPANAREAIVFDEPQDIAGSLNALADICIEYCVGDAEKAAALKQSYSGESNTVANVGAKFMEAFIELHKKANPSNTNSNANNSTPSTPSTPGEGD